MSSRTQGLNGLIDSEIRAQFPVCSSSRARFLLIIAHVRNSSAILAPKSYCGKSAHARIASMVRALLRITFFYGHGVRPIESWYSDSKSIDDQFHELLRHLFAQYPLPRFLNPVWIHGGPGISIFLKMGLGQSPRKLLGMRMSKSTARHYMTAPDDLNLLVAVYWSEIRAAGGSKKLARAMVRSYAILTFDDDFRRELVQFFCRAEQSESPVLNLDEVDPIIEFVRGQKFEPASKILGYKVAVDIPLQPELSLRKKSLRWIRRRLANWRTEIEIPAPAGRPVRRGSWPRCGINGFELHKEYETWKVEELLTAHDLLVEGGIMRNCVSSYEFVSIREIRGWSV